jgi:hypothetical protein
LLPLLGFISEILPIVFYLVFLKRNRGEGLGVIFIYCCLSMLSEPIFPDMLHLKISQDALGSTFTIIEFTLASYFFFTTLQRKTFKYIPLAGALLFYPVAIFNFTRTSEGFDSIPASLEAILIILYCILTLYEQISDPKVIFAYYNKKFWATIAFFLYFSSTLFLFLYARTLVSHGLDKYWAINNFFEILKNILFCISFIMKKNLQKSYQLDNLDPDI